MQLEVKGKNVEVSDSIRSYAESKLRRLERQLSDPTVVELELAVERNPSIAENQVAEATVWTKGPVLRAREASSDMKASIDQLANKLARQVKRYREKRVEEPRRGDHPAPAVESLDGPEPLIVKSKQFPVKPMSAGRGCAAARARRARLLRLPERRVRGTSTSSTGGATGASG